MRTALLLVGHGSRSEHADDVMPFYVDAIKNMGKFTSVQACYLEHEPRLEDSITKIDADRVLVMPLLLAHGYHTRVTIPEALGIKSGREFVDGREIIYLEPLGRSAHIVRLILERIGDAAE